MQQILILLEYLYDCLIKCLNKIIVILVFITMNIDCVFLKHSRVFDNGSWQKVYYSVKPDHRLEERDMYLQTK